MSEIKQILSRYPLYNIWGCVFAVYPFPLWWLRGYVLCLIIIIKSEVWTITHCLGLGHEIIVCALYVSLYFFEWLLIVFGHWTMSAALSSLIFHISKDNSYISITDDSINCRNYSFSYFADSFAIHVNIGNLRGCLLFWDTEPQSLDPNMWYLTNLKKSNPAQFLIQ